MKRVRLLGEYDYKNLCVLCLSLVLFPLGLLSSVYNIINLINREFSIHNFYFTFTSSVVLICFSIYYLILVLKKRHHPFLISLSFSFYSYLFYLISDKVYLMSYVLILFSSLLLIVSFTNFRSALISTLIYLWMVVFLFFIKLFGFTPKWMEFNTASPSQYLVIAGLILSGGFFVFVYMLSNELYEKSELRRRMTNSDITDKEKEIIFLHLMEFDKEYICDKLRMDIKTYRVHKANIKKKLLLYKELTRDNIRKKLYNVSDVEKEGKPGRKMYS